LALESSLLMAETEQQSAQLLQTTSTTKNYLQLPSCILIQPDLETAGHTA